MAEANFSLSHSNIAAAIDDQIRCEFIQASQLQVRLKTGNLYSIEEFQTSNCRVRCASFHPIHSNVLACGLRDFNRVIVFKGPDSSSALTQWEANSCQLIFGKFDEFVTSVEWNSNGTQLAAICYNGLIAVWNYPYNDDNAKLFEYPTKISQHSEIVWNPFDPNVLAVYKPPTSVNEFLDEFVILCSTTQQVQQPLLKRFVSESDWFSTVKWISSNRLACGYESGELKILKVETDDNDVKMLEGTLKGHGEWVRSLAWNEKSKKLASCSGDRTIKIWANVSNSDSNEPVYSLKLKKLLYCRSIVWYSSKEDKGEELDLIACGLFNGYIVICSPFAEDYNAEHYLREHSSPVLQVLFSPNGEFLVSNSYGEAVIVWSTKTWEPIYRLAGTFWINSWDNTSCKLAISNRMEEIMAVIEINPCKSQ